MTTLDQRLVALFILYDLGLGKRSELDVRRSDITTLVYFKLNRHKIHYKYVNDISLLIF